MNLRKSSILLVIASLAVVGGLFADHHHFVNAMKGVGGVMKSTGEAVESGDMDTVKKNANQMARNFALMAAWFEGRGTTAAVKLADAAMQDAVAMRKAANAGDAAAVKEAFSGVRGSCKACHAAHRVKNDDGSYGFKD